MLFSHSTRGRARNLPKLRSPQHHVIYAQTEWNKWRNQAPQVTRPRPAAFSPFHQAAEYFGGCMTKIIEFYIPQCFRKVSKWLPPKRQVVNCSAAPHVAYLEKFYRDCSHCVGSPVFGFSSPNGNSSKFGTSSNRKSLLLTELRMAQPLHW